MHNIVYHWRWCQMLRYVPPYISFFPHVVIYMYYIYRSFPITVSLCRRHDYFIQTQVLMEAAWAMSRSLRIYLYVVCVFVFVCVSFCFDMETWLFCEFAGFTRQCVPTLRTLRAALREFQMMIFTPRLSHL